MQRPLNLDSDSCSEYAASVKVSQVLERLREDSSYHPTKVGRVTVAGKPSDDLPPGTLNSIFKQAGWKK